MEWRNHARPLREQLTEALAECRLRILQAAGRPVYGNPGDPPQDNRAEIAFLEAECRRLEREIVDLSDKQ